MLETKRGENTKGHTLKLKCRDGRHAFESQEGKSNKCRTNGHFLMLRPGLFQNNEDILISPFHYI